MEKNQAKNYNEKLYAQIQQVDEALLSRTLDFSLADNIRYVAIKMAYLNAMGEVEKGLALADSLEKLPAYKSLPEEAWASVIYRKANIFLNQEKMLESSRSYQRAIQLFERQAKPNFSELALCHNNLGYVQDILGFQNSSKQSYYRALEIWKTSYLEDFSNISAVLNNLIFAELDYGNLEAAKDLIQFFEKYVSKIKTSFDLSDREEFDIEMFLLLNLTRYHVAANNNRQIDQILTRAERILFKAPKSSFNEKWAVLAAMYELAGFLQKEMKNFQAAVAYYKRMQSLPLSDFFRMKYAANLAIVYYDAQENEKSLRYARQSLDIFEKSGFGGSSGASLLVLQADLLNRLGQEKESIELVEKMLSGLIEKPVLQAEIPFLSYADFQNLNTERHLTILIKSAQIFDRIGRKNNHQPDLKSALVLFEIAAEMFQEYYLKGSYTQSLEEMHRQIQEGLFSLWDEKSLFSVEKKYHILSLLEKNESQQGWKKFLRKNEEFLGSTSEILRELNLKSLEIRESANAQQEKDLRQELEQIENRFREEESYRYFAGGNFNFPDFQKQLDENTAVLKFIYTEKLVFGLLLTQKDLKIHSLGTVEMVNSWTEEFRNSLSKLDDSYRLPASTLYRLLIQPLKNELKEVVFILPDDRLHGLPFEALIDEKGEFLVRRHVISYQRSFRQMVFQSLKSERTQSGFLAAFAPDYTGTSYQAIQNSLEEVKQLSKAFQGRAFIGKEATKTAFVSSLTDFQVHHLAMHAEQNPANLEESALVFSGVEKLFLRDLYQMNFPSELVVLSACNTGMGKLMPGEGLMSLSKALTLAGVKSIVYSLWEIPDKETAALMAYFYEEIKEGHPKNSSLTKAKRRFLEDNPLKNHPVFWAGFVLNGKVEAVEVSWITKYWPWVGGLMVLALAFFFYRLYFRRAL